MRVANSLDARQPTRAAGRTVADLLASWLEVNEATWAEGSRRDNASRVRSIEADPIAKVAIARLSVSDVERWHARMRRAGVGEAAIRGRHSALRAALSSAVRWEWVRGHAGHPENERCDLIATRMAREAARAT